MSQQKIKGQQAAKRRFIASTGTFVFTVFLLGMPLASEAQSLIGQRDQFLGNPRCADWAEMNAGAKSFWTSMFLSTLSMGHETSRRKGQQKFKDLKGIDEVIEVVTTHCAANPEAQASEAAAPFLNP